MSRVAPDPWTSRQYHLSLWVWLLCCSVDEDHREDRQVPNRVCLPLAYVRLCNPITVPYFLPRNALVNSCFDFHPSAIFVFLGGKISGSIIIRSVHNKFFFGMHISTSKYSTVLLVLESSAKMTLVLESASPALETLLPNSAGSNRQIFKLELYLAVFH